MGLAARIDRQASPCNLLNLSVEQLNCNQMYQQAEKVVYTDEVAVFHTDFWEDKIGDMMLLGWESNTSVFWQKWAKLVGGNLSLVKGSHSLYETLAAEWWYVAFVLCGQDHTKMYQSFGQVIPENSWNIILVL